MPLPFPIFLVLAAPASDLEAKVKAIFDGLNWLGLGGDDEPVLQSSRAGRHAQVAHELVARGGLYARLAAMQFDLAPPADA